MSRHPDRRRLTLAAAAVLLCAAAPAPSGPAGLPDDMTMGSKKAEVTVIEYASASCPHCARFNNEIFPEFKKKYIDTGKVRYVFREFLTQPVEIAAAGFLLARCAGQKNYFTVIDRFFRGQAKMYQTGDSQSLILAAGAAGGLSKAQIQTCLSDEAATDALNARVVRYMSKDGVDSTPTFVINGKKLADLDHEVELSDLDAVIQPLLKTKGR